MSTENEFDGFLSSQEFKDENLKKALNRIGEDDKKACYEFMKKLREDAGRIINGERLLAERAKNKVIQNSLAEFQNSYIELRNSLIDDLFREVLSNIVDYVETADYSDALVKDVIKTRKLITGEINLYLCPRDMFFSHRFEGIQNITILECDDNYIGGYKIKLKDSNIVIDNSYKTMIKKAKKAFIISNLEKNSEIHNVAKPPL